MSSRTLIIITLFSVLLVSALGSLGFGMMNKTISQFCPINALGAGDNCVQIPGEFGMALQRLAGLKQLLLATIDIDTLLIAVVMVVLLLPCYSFAHTLIKNQTPFSYTHFLLTLCLSVPYHSFFSWLALHSKQDTDDHDQRCMISLSKI